MTSPRITVCTPTWNRAHTLHIPYESLVAQTAQQDLEWILWDDGSTDDTPAVVDRLAREAPFEMVVRRTPNRGKFACVNDAVKLARGELFVILDSDDALLPHALETFLAAWDDWPRPGRDDLMGLMALCRDAEGRTWGTELPDDLRASTYLDLLTRHGVRGEKCEALQTDVLERFPWPVFEGETHVPPTFPFNRAGRAHPFGLLNEVVREYVQQPDSLSKRIVALRARNAEGYRTYYREFIEDDVPWRWRLRNAINYLRFSLHKGVSPARAIAECRTSAAKLAATSVLSAGLVAWAIDRRSLG